MFGNPLPAYRHQDRDCLAGQVSFSISQQPLNYANDDYDLLACAFHHFKIEEGWKLAVIAIALQRSHNIEHVDSIQDEGGHRMYQVEFNQLAPRQVSAEYVDSKIERRGSDLLFRPIWEYWAHYDPATRTSTVRHLRDFPPNIEMLEAKAFDLRQQYFLRIQAISLSRLRALKYRKYWESGTRIRYDPPVLSINRQIHEEASEILYRRTFIIEVNCGLYQDEESLDGTTTYDSKWRGTKLSARFPFHKARQITIRLDTHLYCNQDHVFHHMVYTCGLLLWDAEYIQKLRVELRAEDRHGIALDPDCRSWKETTEDTGFAGRFNMAADYSTPDAQADTLPADQIDKQVAFLLQPLALRGRVQSSEIVFCSEQQPSGKLRATMAYYHAVLSGEKGTGIPNWIRSEYEFIFFRREQRARTRELTHKAWLRETHENYNCPHSGFGKK
ncbi:MAG: hypothetical protein LQ339_001861 [Xanthoria mediterranea]|nr:MAG: hypothetical protein LQ339_001861 [Xanthoria mediterranea]